MTDEPHGAEPPSAVEPPTPAAPIADPDSIGGLAASVRDAWRDERVEVVAAVLLSLATVLSAWGAYQATRWGGVQANSYAESAALRASSSRHGTTASRQIQIDVATYIAWVDARAQKDMRLADFYRARFREEFVPAFDTWATSAQLDAEGIPIGTPFDKGDYVVAEQLLSNDLLEQADAALADAQAANQISDNFVLTAVLFASVLFFAGIAAKFRPQWIRWSMLGVAVIVFGIGLIVEFSLPQNVGF